VKDLLAVARNRNLAILMAGRIVSVGGDYVYQVALSIAIFAYSHNSSLAVSAFWIARLAPSLALGAPAGALADRLGYRRSMIIADLGRLVLVALMALVAHPSTWLLLYPLVFLVTAFSSLFSPASLALIPAIVRDRDKRMAANAAIGEVASIASIVGSALGGIFAGAGHVTALLVFDALTFGISAASIALIRTAPKVAVAAEEADEADEAEGEEDAADEEGGFFGGFRLLARRPLLVFAASVMALPELTSGAILVWIVPYAEQFMGKAGVGYLSAALGVGAVIGGLIAASVGGTIRLDVLLAIGVAVLGASMMVFGGVHFAVVAVACLIVLGLAETLEYTAYETLLQGSVPENMIGRAAGSMDTLFFNLMLAGNLLSGLLAATLGLTVSIVSFGVGILVVTAASWVYFRQQTIGQPDATDLARIPAFESCPIEIREWAVRRMLREQYDPGTVVIHQGDIGDRFYVIARGHARVEVAADTGTLEVQLNPRDFFGEIALLENVPRVATVRAIDKLTVFAMSREDFDQLTARTADLKKSLLETASAREEMNRTFRLNLGSPLN
jgi:MFS family permease